MLVFRLALRALRWRAGAAATVFAVALIAVLAATIGPIYLHAVDETVLTRHLSDARYSQRDLYVSRNTLLKTPDVNWSAQVRSLSNEAADRRWFARPVFAEQAGVSYRDPAQNPYVSHVATVDGLCAHLRMTSGRCVPATSTDDTMISTDTANRAHLSLGDVVSLTAAGGQTVALHVVGVYQPVAPNGDFWKPWNFFNHRDPPFGDNPPNLDSFLVSTRAMATREDSVPETLAGLVALDVGRVRYDDVGAVRASLARTAASLVRFKAAAIETGVPTATVVTGLGGVLNSAAKEAGLTRTLVTVATVQLALLAIFVLFGVVAGTTSAQGPEVALAKLRGRRTRSVLLQGVLQPVLLVVLATPIGALAAWGVVRLLVVPLLGHQVDVTFPATAYAVAAIAMAGGILAAVVAARRIVVSPVGALLRRGADVVASPVGLAVADAAAVALAVAGLVELKVGGVLDGNASNPLSALAPTLLAIAIAVVVLRLLPFIGRALTRWTRDSTRVASFLAVRQILRRRTGARALILVAVAIALATFAVTNWSTARTNRQLRALNDAGASTVLRVRPGAGVEDLRTAVDRADPGGHSAAVAYSTADQLPPLLAVDTSRFAAVGAWLPDNTHQSLASVLTTLAGHRPDPVSFTGTRLRFDLSLGRHPRSRVHLDLGLVGTDHSVVARRVGPVGNGSHTYEVSLPAGCAQGCHFADLMLSADTPDDPFSTGPAYEIDARLAAQVYAGGRWKPIDGFGDASRWRGDGKPTVAIASGAASSLALAVHEPAGGSWPSVVSAATPISVPAVVASGTASRYRGDEIHSLVGVGLDGNTLNVNGVIRSTTLPRVDRDGLLVDYGTALNAMTSTPALTTQYQVWLAPGAPSDMSARLAAHHVQVTGRILPSTYRTPLDRSGPAFADSLFLIAALAATLLAVGATVAGGVISARRRSYELAALEAVGVSPRSLRRSAAAEQGIVFGLGLVVGLGAGLAGSALALPSTPVFLNNSVGPRLVYQLPWTLLAILVGALLVVAALTSTGLARLVEHQATPGQLRGAQQ